MPTVLTIRNIRVAIYTNDHPPPHVHALKGNQAEARFKLNCPEGPVELWDHEGFRLSELNEISAAITDHLGDICRKWREIHG
ncbi:hypothetical protein ABI_16500 [Asticcacaulis biprosthecium C19]|uniref:DUF4160 domain-containing protein n=1 Tax=Asticcacaulis biprosthecium C19 TaxID=715226 RepID=F4QJV3_9CAUL|nr:DUF4160 domain-containing protein [Asticcacaulis biprosthecium]EGF93210.1 hypothetical protein ABI_16500 [Asticcacaulis biprosthecium C19]